MTRWRRSLARTPTRHQGRSPRIRKIPTPATWNPTPPPLTRPPDAGRREPVVAFHPGGCGSDQRSGVYRLRTPRNLGHLRGPAPRAPPLQARGGAHQGPLETRDSGGLRLVARFLQFGGAAAWRAAISLRWRARV